MCYRTWKYNLEPVIIYQLGAGRAGHFFGKPVMSFLRRPPPRQIFISKSTPAPPPPPQQQTGCNAELHNGPSPLLSQQIITLEIPNGILNVIKHKIDKKGETMILLNQERKKKVDGLFSKIVKSVMNFPKHTCTEIYGAFQQTWIWLKCRFTGLWLHMPVERLSPKVGSIPAFHSVQQNINNFLKYFK